MSSVYKSTNSRGTACLFREFGFEKDTANVNVFTRQWKIGYPVAADKRMGIWEEFNNQYWPALYLADAKGILRYHRFDEGEYDQTEKVIQLIRQHGAIGDRLFEIEFSDAGVEGFSFTFG